jgi:hypothetical protein
MNPDSPTPPPPPKRRQRPESKTSSTETEAPPAPTVEALLAKLAASLAENFALYDDLFKILDGDADQVPPDVRPGKHDMVLLYDVKLIGKEGVLTRLHGRADFPESLHPHSMATTLRNFQRVFTTMVGEPLAVKLNRLLSDLGLSLTAQDGPPNLPSISTNTVEESRENGSILDPQD